MNSTLVTKTFLSLIVPNDQVEGIAFFVFLRQENGHFVSFSIDVSVIKKLYQNPHNYNIIIFNFFLMKSLQMSI